MNGIRPSLMDPNFRYYKAAETDVRRTFARIRREQKQAEQKPANVCPLKARKA